MDAGADRHTGEEFAGLPLIHSPPRRQHGWDEGAERAEPRMWIRRGSPACWRRGKAGSKRGRDLVQEKDLLMALETELMMEENLVVQMGTDLDLLKVYQ